MSIKLFVFLILLNLISACSTAIAKPDFQKSDFEIDAVPISVCCKDDLHGKRGPYLPADGISKALITIKLKNNNGIHLAKNKDLKIQITTSAGKISKTQFDDKEGVFIAYLTSSDKQENAIVKYTVNDKDSTQKLEIPFLKNIVLNGDFERNGVRHDRPNAVYWGAINSSSNNIDYKDSFAGKRAICLKRTGKEKAKKSGISQTLKFTNRGRFYQGSLWLKGTPGLKSRVYLQQVNPYYSYVGIKSYQLTDKWTKVTFTAATHIPDSYSLRIEYETKPGQAGVMCIDDVRLQSSGHVDFVFKKKSIDKRFFNYNSASLPASVWPEKKGFPVDSIRIYSGWNAVEKKPGQYIWTNTVPRGGMAGDKLINFLNSKGAEPMMVIGTPPKWTWEKNWQKTNRWLTINNFNNWENWIKTIGNHYKGRVRYYQLWNEIDMPFRVKKNGKIRFGPGYKDYQNGEKVVALTKSAHKILKSIDPNITIVAPSATMLHAAKFYDSFFYHGGGKYIDVIAFHCYPGNEQAQGIAVDTDGCSAVAAQLRSLRDAYNLQHLPIWNTESGVSEANDENGNRIFRHLVSTWISGVERIFYYNLDNNPTPFELYDWKYGKLTNNGKGFRMAANLLNGAKVVRAETKQDGTATVELLLSSGRKVYILWNLEQKVSMSIPPQWRVKTIKTIDSQRDFQATIPNQVEIGREVKLLFAE
ncbi:hypothetical protein Riv7116_0471 [Rivularia sp. PCC 7116]|uniref:invasin domain 3-containing protein n=1 Tax=Rivularia sp. PCC 7116 TaxID=373994 RepID=UPI00029F0CEE|nr:invasin domain 3-containing protein [Rivularia sp. PCC 7116]AFY53072.1 hypothetical protein Riv7116_0471 [Rivularia sp. PCC 7116]